MIRADHTLNIKQGEVSIFFKETLPLNAANTNYLDECIVVEILCNNQKGFLLSLYRSPTQATDEFENFIKNFELLLDALFNSNPYLILILGDFNAKSNSWCEDDHDSLEGTKIETVTSSFGLTQLISDPTHILPSSSSCIDLIFINQLNLVNKSGVYS